MAECSNCKRDVESTKRRGMDEWEWDACEDCWKAFDRGTRAYAYMERNDRRYELAKMFAMQLWAHDEGAHHRTSTREGTANVAVAMADALLKELEKVRSE